METVQVILDGELLRAADRAARKLKTSRSALFREALRAHLESLDIRERERRDREGYIRYPDSQDEPAVWGMYTFRRMLSHLFLVQGGR